WSFGYIRGRIVLPPHDGIPRGTTESPMSFCSILARGRARARAAVLVVALGVAACDFNGDPLVILPEFDDVTSFETDLEKWVPRAVDIGTPPATWEVVRSGDRATQGTQ